MAESRGTWDKNDVEYIIGLVEKAWNAQFTALQNSNNENFIRLEQKVDAYKKQVDAAMTEVVHKKDFDDYKLKTDSEIGDLKKVKAETEKTTKLFSVIRENWRLFIGIFVAGALVAAALAIVGIYFIFTPKTEQISTMADEVHVIAQYHQRHAH